jgi:hypothetical protein
MYHNCAQCSTNAQKFMLMHSDAEHKKEAKRKQSAGKYALDKKHKKPEVIHSAKSIEAAVTAAWVCFQECER